MANSKATNIKSDRDVAVIGAAALPVGRHTPRQGEVTQHLEHELLAKVVFAALADAGISKGYIDSAVFTLPPATTRQLGFATFMAAQLGLRCTGQICEVAEMGITGGLAFDQAAADIMLGHADFALALGVSLQTATPAADAMDQSIRVVGDVDFQAPFGITPISWYALDAVRYMYETGATRAELAEVAVKSRQLAAANPLAQFTKALTLEEVLSQRPIVEPLGLLEVPARGDGAVCLVLARESAARDLGNPYIKLKGRGFYHEGFHQIGDRPHDITAFPAARHAGKLALENAAVALADLDLAELYAPCTITEVLVSEALGFYQRGEGTKAVAAGDTTVGGGHPINTSGGCLSRGHPPSLTALYGIIELREQLLQRAGRRQVKGAELAMHCCELGNYNAALIHIFEGPQ